MGNVHCNAVVDWEEAESLFVATVPAPTASTYVETKEEARTKGKEAIPVTIKGLQAEVQPVSLGISQGV